MPELLRLAEEVQKQKSSCIVRRGDDDLAVLSPVPAKPIARRTHMSGDRRTGPNDPFWQLVGSVRSDGPDDIAEHVDEYLTETHTLPGA